MKNGVKHCVKHKILLIYRGRCFTKQLKRDIWVLYYVILDGVSKVFLEGVPHEFAYSVADTFSLGKKRSGTKFAKIAH